MASGCRVVSISPNVQASVGVLRNRRYRGRSTAIRVNRYSSSANRKNTDLQQREPSIQRQRIGSLHALPAGHIVTTPGASTVPHRPGRGRPGQDERALPGLRLDGGVVRALAHELRVHSAAPEADVLGSLAVGYINCLERALPVVARDVVLVVVVPHGVDTDTLQVQHALVPPVVPGLGGEVDVAAHAALAAARAPQPRDSRLAGAGVLEEGAGLGQGRVRRVIGQDVRLDVGEQADAVGVGLACECPRVREPVPVPGHDVAGLGLRLGDGVPGAHLERGAGHVVLLAVADEAEYGVARADGRVLHRVLHAAADVAHHVPGHAQGEPDEPRVRLHDLGNGAARDQVLVEPAVRLPIDLVVAPEAVDLGPDGPAAAGVRRREDADAALGGRVDEPRDVLVERIRPVRVVAERVRGRDEEAPAAEVHGGCLLPEPDM